MTFSTVGILYHPRVLAAPRLAEEVRLALDGRVRRVWSFSAWDPSAPDRIAGTDLLLCIGGDGTVLRAARIAIPHPIPILGVNMGRLGFLSELSPDALLPWLSDVLDGAGRIEERTMLRAELLLPDGSPAPGLPPQHALNDVTLGRSGGRPVDVRVRLDGVQVEVVRADGVIVCTATGSTGYNLSAGGPVLWPEARAMVLTPVAAHLSRVRPIVLPDDLSVELWLESEARAIVSFDGQVDHPLGNGVGVRIQRSEFLARFLRLGPPTDFYRNLTNLLDFNRPSYAE